MTDSVTQICALASKIARLERKYRALSHRMDRADATWDREGYESNRAAQRALGNSEASVCELADLMRTWGISFDDLALYVNRRTLMVVCEAFEGWEVDCR